MKDTMNYSGFSDILINFRRGDETANNPRTMTTHYINQQVSTKYSSCPPYLEVGLSAKKLSNKY